MTEDAKGIAEECALCRVAEGRFKYMELQIDSLRRETKELWLFFILFATIAAIAVMLAR